MNHQTPLAAGQHAQCFLQTPAAPAFWPRGQRFHSSTHFSCCAGDPFSCSLSIGCYSTQELHEKKGEDMIWSRKASDALGYGPHKEQDLIFEASCTCRQVRQSLHICFCKEFLRVGQHPPALFTPDSPQGDILKGHSGLLLLQCSEWISPKLLIGC